MPRKLRSHLTFANVASALALFVALGGTSYAAVQISSGQIKNNSIQSKDIKNNSIGTKDVHNGSLLSKDFKKGQVPKGATGPVGPKGPQGVPGQPGTTGVANVTVRTKVSIAPTSTQHSGFDRVLCEFGERATGGGASFKGTSGNYETSNPDRIINYSRPVTHTGINQDPPSEAGDTPTGWETGWTLKNSNGQTVVSYAVCVSD